MECGERDSTRTSPCPPPRRRSRVRRRGRLSPSVTTACTGSFTACSLISLEEMIHIPIVSSCVLLPLRIPSISGALTSALRPMLRYEGGYILIAFAGALADALLCACRVRIFGDTSDCRAGLQPRSDPQLPASFDDRALPCPLGRCFHEICAGCRSPFFDDRAAGYPMGCNLFPCDCRRRLPCPADLEREGTAAVFWRPRTRDSARRTLTSVCRAPDDHRAAGG